MDVTQCWGRGEACTDLGYESATRLWALLEDSTELFRDWKSPVADKARGIIKRYLGEVQKFAAS